MKRLKVYRTDFVECMAYHSPRMNCFSNPMYSIINHYLQKDYWEIKRRSPLVSIAILASMVEWSIPSRTAFTEQPPLPEFPVSLYQSLHSYNAMPTAISCLCVDWRKFCVVQVPEAYCSAQYPIEFIISSVINTKLFTITIFFFKTNITSHILWLLQNECLQVLRFMI